MNEVDPTQLFLLAELAGSGPARKRHLQHVARFMHILPVGHMPVRTGLRRLEQAGLIVATRDKPGGWLSAGVVYALTNEGTQELASLREMLLADELAAKHLAPAGFGAPARWWVRTRRAFDVWLETPLARRSGELR